MPLVYYETPFHVTHLEDEAVQKDLELLVEMWHNGAGEGLELHEF